MPVSTAVLQTGTQYTPGLTLGPDDQIREIRWNVSAPNAAIASIAKDSGGKGKPAFTNDEFIVQPGPDGFAGDSGCKGIRFRSFAAATPTTVVATAYFYDDPAPVGLVPSNTQFAGGSQTPVGATLQFQHNSVLVANEAAINFKDGSYITWTVVDDPANGSADITPVYFAGAFQTTTGGAATNTTTAYLNCGAGVNGHVLVKRSGIFLFTIGCRQYNSSNGAGGHLQMVWGTGAPPAAGTGPTGTAVGGESGDLFSNGGLMPQYASLTGVVNTGQVVGTEIWVDLQLKSDSAGAAYNADNMTTTIVEL